jgi:glycosyltransferase involved in cell wall biosynthesis
MRKKGKIRLLHILPFLNKGGGTENIVFDLLSRLDHAIYEKQVCVTHKPADGLQALRFKTAGIDVYELPRKENRRERFAGLLKYLRSNDFDIAHIHAYDGNENHARFVCILAGVPAILTYDHRFAFWNDKPVFNLVWSVLNLFTYKNIAISDTCRDFRKQCCFWQKDKVITVNNGVDLDVFSPASSQEKRKFKIQYGIDPGDLVVGAAGRLVEVKRFDMLIKAAKLMENRKNITFIIAGSGHLEGSLKRLAGELGLKKIRFTGWLNDIPSFYKALDAYLMSSEFHEGFGLVTAEAMASGVPVVAINDPNHMKVINPGHAIFVVPTPRGISDGIEKILDNRQLALELMAKGRKRAEECFDINRAVKEIEEIYLCAIRSKSFKKDKAGDNSANHDCV